MSRPLRIAFAGAVYSDSRNEAMLNAYLSGRYTLKEIGDYFGLHYSRVSRIVAKGKI